MSQLTVVQVFFVVNCFIVQRCQNCVMIYYNKATFYTGHKVFFWLLFLLLSFKTKVCRPIFLYFSLPSKVWFGAYGNYKWRFSYRKIISSSDVVQRPVQQFNLQIQILRLQQSCNWSKCKYKMHTKWNECIFTFRVILPPASYVWSKHNYIFIYCNAFCDQKLLI